MMMMMTKKKKKMMMMMFLPRQNSMRDCCKSQAGTHASPPALFVMCNFHDLGINIY